MARSSFALLRAAAVVTLATQTVAQTCYYPNGKVAPDTEKPCSSASGSACCPDTWECLDNGLCHNPAANIYGRYSCTDKDWNSPGCPSNMCTYGGTAYGGESITTCSSHNNDWCCNADATNVNCCQESPVARPFFQLQDGRAYATVGRNKAPSAPTLSSITGLATKSTSGNAASQTPAPLSSENSPDAFSTSAAPSAGDVSSTEPITSEVTSVSSGAAGVVTIIQTVVTTPSGVPVDTSGTNNSSNGGSGSNTGLIVGCAVGVPLALALLGIIIWMLRKRRNQKNAYKETPEMDGDNIGSPTFAGGAAAKLGKKDVYRHSRLGTSEIDSNPVGPGRPVSNIPGHAELDSGAGFQPGYGPAYAPDTVGIGGGNGDGQSMWGNAPPRYSPGTNQMAFNQQPAAAELDATSTVLPVINEKDTSQQYQANEPPQPVAELPTIKTPPEDVEKQLQK